jgi:hypothetical protein
MLPVRPSCRPSHGSTSPPTRRRSLIHPTTKHRSGLDRLRSWLGANGLLAPAGDQRHGVATGSDRSATPTAESRSPTANSSVATRRHKVMCVPHLTRSWGVAKSTARGTWGHPAGARRARPARAGAQAAAEAGRDHYRGADARRAGPGLGTRGAVRPGAAGLRQRVRIFSERLLDSYETRVPHGRKVVAPPLRWNRHAPREARQFLSFAEARTDLASFCSPQALETLAGREEDHRCVRLFHTNHQIGVHSCLSQSSPS